MIRILTLILATILISNIAHAKCDLKYELGDPITKKYPSVRIIANGILEALDQ